MWLANELGYVHVDDLLDQLTPEEFRERFAYWLLTDTANQRRRHAELIAETHNTVNRYVLAKSGKNPKPSQLLQADDLIASIYRDEPDDVDPIENVDPEQLARSLGCL